MLLCWTNLSKPPYFSFKTSQAYIRGNPNNPNNPNSDSPDNPDNAHTLMNIYIHSYDNADNPV